MRCSVVLVLCQIWCTHFLRDVDFSPGELGAPSPDLNVSAIDPVRDDIRGPLKVLTWNVLFMQQSSNCIPWTSTIDAETIQLIDDSLKAKPVNCKCHTDNKNYSSDMVLRPVHSWKQFNDVCIRLGVFHPEWWFARTEDGKRARPTNADTFFCESWDKLTHEDRGLNRTTLAGILRNNTIGLDPELAKRIFDAIQRPNAYRLWPTRGPELFGKMLEQNADAIGINEYDFRAEEAKYDGTHVTTFHNAMNARGYIGQMFSKQRRGRDGSMTPIGKGHALYWQEARLKVLDSLWSETLDVTLDNGTRCPPEVVGGGLFQRPGLGADCAADNTALLAVTQLTTDTNDEDKKCKKKEFSALVNVLMNRAKCPNGQKVPVVVFGDMNCDMRSTETRKRCFGIFESVGDPLVLGRKKLDGKNLLFGSTFPFEDHEALCTSPSAARKEFIDDLFLLKAGIDGGQGNLHGSAEIKAWDEDNRPLSHEAIIAKYCSGGARHIIPDATNPSDHMPVLLTLDKLLPWPCYRGACPGGDKCNCCDKFEPEAIEEDPDAYEATIIGHTCKKVMCAKEGASCDACHCEAKGAIQQGASSMMDDKECRYECVDNKCQIYEFTMRKKKLFPGGCSWNF